MGLVQKAFSDIITFSRSSNATRVGPTGLVEYAPHNLILQSQTFDNASWAAGNATVTANAAPAPDGTVTAELLIENSSNAEHRVFQSVTTVASTYTVSCYIKANTRNWAYIRIRDSSSADRLAFFNLATGVIGTVQTGLTASIQSVGNNWYRCVVTISSAFAGSNPIVFGVSSADNTEVYTGNGTGSIYLWGAQLAVGPYALDYTPTTSAAVYGPRFDYDPVTLAARGLLVEEQRTNLVTWSEDFSNGSWIKGLATISANSGTAPDGTQTADKLIPTAVSSADHGVYQITAASGVGVYTVSAFVKAAGYNFADIFDGYGSALITVDLTNGSYSVVGSPTATSVTAFGNGWYRVTITRTVSGVPAYIQIRAQNDINRTAFTGDGTSGIYVWGAQSEQASFATSYIPTIGTVTRSADVASVNTLSPWFNATEGTLFAEASRPALGGAAAFACLSTDPNNRIQIGNRTGGGGTARLDYWVSTLGVDQAYLTFDNTFAANTPAKIAGAYKADDFAASANGATTKTDSSGSVPAIVSLLLGANTTTPSSILNGHLRRVAFFPRRLSDAELQALTA